MKNITLLSEIVEKTRIFENLTDTVQLPHTLRIALHSEYRDKIWQLPNGWIKIEVARKRAVDLLIPSVMDKIHNAWDPEVPDEIWPRIQKVVGSALRKAVASLTDAYGRNIIGTGWLAHYWEPAEASVALPETLTDIQLLAYRWAVAIVGAEVRNSDLENIHAMYTSDDCMPAFNRGVRNAALDVMLRDEWVGYYLGQWPGFLLFLKANGVPYPIPRTVGLPATGHL
jgi:hypothetical protein